jgi:hypothetical protein
MLVPTSNMCRGQSVHISGEIAMPSRSEQEMPVIRHEAVCKETHVNGFVSIKHHPLKGRVVAAIFEYGHACIATIDDVKYVAGGLDSRSARHDS